MFAQIIRIVKIVKVVRVVSSSKKIVYNDAMARTKNPFSPGTGTTPPYLAGRVEELTDFRYALLDGPGSHERLSLVSGMRGVGKTVLLNEFEDIARAESWWVISETATPGFMERIRDKIYSLAKDQFDLVSRKLTGLNTASLGGIQLSEAEKFTPTVTLRDVLTDFLELQAERDEKLNQPPVGVLITLDELHYYHQSEIIEFGATIQHLVRENREIALAMAGIPQSIKPLLANDRGRNPVTFLRRANRIDLGLISDDDVATALAEPLKNTEISWDDDALAEAVSICGGYPFMIQLIGQQAFRKKEGRTISIAAVRTGGETARRKLGQLVHDTALSDLSPVDRTFLAAMAVDNGPSRMADIAQRLKADAQYVGKYRGRLLEAGVIVRTAHGYVDFQLPYMRDYLRKHVVVDSLAVTDLFNE